MSPGQAAFLFVAALIAGALNSVAGGGSFISFPALLFMRVAPIPANATNTAAMWPGTVASTGAYWKEISAERSEILLPLILTGLIGGLLGAHILLSTPQGTFLRLIPWLMLVATLLFFVSPWITRWVRKRGSAGKNFGPFRMALGLLLQLVIAIYIGYFGAGAGILMLALLALMGVENIHAMNGIKTLVVSVINAVALATFIWAKVIFWPQALVMIVGAAAGGYGGAHYAQKKLNPQSIRWLVIVTGLAMSLYFFIRY
ncbi:MAG: sulfite exporter TauE/SafE family protein [Candidatus Acidiferrales bacterium]